MSTGNNKYKTVEVKMPNGNIIKMKLRVLRLPNQLKTEKK